MIRDFLTSQKNEAFSYRDVGASRHCPPAGYAVDHYRVRLGSGPGVFDAAAAALDRWRMFQIGWLALCWPAAPIQAGYAVAVLVRACGLWSLNACRVVYVLDETAPARRHGFAYGTLPDHAESGEERFLVERLADESVWYDVLAFSRPRHPLARIGYPVSRRLQKRFARDSMAAMAAAVRGG